MNDVHLSCVALRQNALTFAVVPYIATSGVTTNFVRGGGGSTNSVEDRENGDLGAVAP
jgi:hypothetical protein